MPFWKRKSRPSVRHPKNDIAYQGVVFRRSRTLTGSASSNVSSTNETKAHLKSHRLKEHQLKKHRRLLGLGLLGLIALSGFFVWLLDQYVVSVDTIVSTQKLAKPLDVNNYKNVINDYLNSRPAERFRFLLDEDRLNEYVREKKTEIASIDIYGKKGLVAADATVTFRTAVAVWQVNNVKYYVDASGETYQKNYFSEPIVSVKDESGITPKTTELIASSRLLRFLGQTVSGLNGAGLGTVTNVTIPGGTLRQLDIMLDSRPYRIKTHMDRDVVEQVADIVVALHYLDSKQLTPEYVDVRVSSKAYYR